MKNTNELVWLQVDTANLPVKTAKLWVELKEANDAAKAAKAAFEAEFLKVAKAGDKLAKNETLAFGYRFGKLAVAKTTADKPAATKKQTNFF
jgi:hypothetical protein